MSNPTSTEQKAFKVVLVGDGGTGKTSFIVRQQSGEFLSDYAATLGVEKYPLKFNTTHGTYTINLWDTSGQEKIGPMRDSYYEEADAAILFFDVTSKITYKSIPGWHQDIVRVRQNIPVVLCANKTDVKERKVKSKSILYPSKHDIGFYEISVKEDKQILDPIQYLLQQLTNKPDLKINGSYSEIEDEETVLKEYATRSDKREQLDFFQNCPVTDLSNAGIVEVHEICSSKKVSETHSIPSLLELVAPQLFSNISTIGANGTAHNKNSTIIDDKLRQKPSKGNFILKPSSF